METGATASTTASPRIRSTSPQRSVASSTRSSLSVDRPALPTQRRNRAALRSYYNLKQGTAATGSTPTPPPATLLEEVEEKGELDRDGFDHNAYVKRLLGQENLESVLKSESNLINDIRGLDGERKSLVYDNYSKLIAATETIGKLRTNMDPLGPVMATLSPAVSSVAQTSTMLSTSLKDHVIQAGSEKARGQEALKEDEKRAKQRKTVMWVLDTPQRLEALLAEGKRVDARSDWAQIEPLLDSWNGVSGVEDVRSRSKKILDLV